MRKNCQNFVKQKLSKNGQNFVKKIDKFLKILFSKLCQKIENIFQKNFVKKIDKFLKKKIVKTLSANIFFKYTFKNNDLSPRII